ncbi:dimethylglycine dehydrogenase [Polymorphobacter multimanifer]|uniref:Cyclohexyl-isocyanide hydratase n=1 Tax=Polymorphobacter multimanifer TaxID=1070431 RepID=A0A841L8Z0_9SPHN|nr:DJ-1/PfpI family protein [Polymorphobacter multimanifer]MBB6229107.1 cyclohexyl-isocyanide hydratase [Polymorphobacter multimanifer]GGI83106.1 dimethylglycine dehydrogenase [Polymorphobacter multimanifer]
MDNFRIGFLLFPNLTQLDLTGPAQVLSRMPGAVVDYVGQDLAPVMSDCRLALVPTRTLADADRYDMIVVPGGYGVPAVMADRHMLGWLRDQAETAKLVTSVCNGSLILAAAGLLKGYRAGCHWAWGQELARFGATFVAERTVVDRNRITAGGVTSGIDFAFRVIEQLHGRDVAETIQLTLEYDPVPLGGGTPATARPEILASLRANLAPRMAEPLAAIRAVPPFGE